MAGENEEAGLTAEALRQLAESADKQRIATGLQIELMHKMATEMGLNTGKLKSGNSALEDFISETRSATEAEKANAAALKKEQEALNHLTMAGNKAGEGLGLFGKGLLTAGGDMTKYSGAVGSMGDAAMSAGRAFGPLGMALGIAVKAITALFGAVMEQNKNMLNASDSLAKIGATGDLTTKDIQALGRRAGYSTDQLDKFAGVIKRLGPDIIGLGVSATSGAKSMAKLMEMDETVLAGFRNLGVSQEELNANQADYIKLQVASGEQITQRSKQDGSLRKASIEYTNNLLELSALSGEDIDSIKKKQEMNRADLAFATRMAIMQDKEEAIRARASSATDQRTKDDLNAQADKIAQERDNMKKLQDVASTMGMSQKEMAGFNSMLSTGNFNELSAGFAAGTPGILEFIKAVKEGKKSPEELRIFMAEATKKTRDAMGEAIIQNKEIGDNVAYSSGLLANESKYRGMNAEEFKKQVEQERIDRAKNAAAGNDAAKDARNAQETAERRSRMAKDDIVNLIQGPLTKAFEWLMTSVTTVAKYLAKFAVWLGAPDFTDMFKTPDEIKKEQAETVTQLSKVNGNIAVAQKALADPKGALEDAKKVQQQHTDEYTANQQHIEQLKQQRATETDEAKRRVLTAQIIEGNQKSQEINRQVMADKRQVAEMQEVSSASGKQKIEERLLKLQKEKLELEEKQKKQQEALTGRTEAGAVAPGTTPSTTPSGPAPATPPVTQDIQQNLNSMAEEMKKRGMTDPEYIKATLANVMKESGGKMVNEDLNYGGTSNDRIRKIFGQRATSKSDEELNTIKKDPSKMGEMMYGKDTDIGKGMGNTEIGDGFKYRGRGFIGITGKSLYAQASQALFGDDRLVKNPDLINDPKVAAPAAAWYMEKTRGGMAKKMGIDLTKPMNAESSAQLATSQIAGRDVNKSSDYIKGELMGKVRANMSTTAVASAASGSSNTTLASAPVSPKPIVTPEPVSPKPTVVAQTEQKPVAPAPVSPKPTVVVQTEQKPVTVAPATVIPKRPEDPLKAQIWDTKYAKMQLPKAPEATVAAIPNPAQKIKENTETTVAKTTTPTIQSTSKTDTAKAEPQKGDTLLGVMESIHELLNNKFDAMITAMNDNNDTSIKLLNHSRG
jgi:putative chitinase